MSLSLLGSMSSAVLSSPAQLEGLELGHLLGKGTFGSVVGPTGTFVMTSDNRAACFALSDNP